MNVCRIFNKQIFLEIARALINKGRKAGYKKGGLCKNFKLASRARRKNDE
jgi:hypothetical protein